MENLDYRHSTPRRAAGTKAWAIVGIVASGQLEVLVERVAPAGGCEVHIRTAAHGFGDVWQAVITDFVQRQSTAGLKFSINDGGARPDMVMLRLTQAVRAIAGERT